MAGSNQLIVEVIGDTKRLTSDLRSATTQINRFAASTSKIRSTGADPLLASVRAMKVQAAGLQTELARVDAAAASSGARISGFALKAGAAGIATHILGTNLSQLGGTAGRVGNALSQLTSGNIVGFSQSIRNVEGKVKALNENLLKSGDAAKATALANNLAAAGFDKLSAAADAAATSIRAATNAFVDNTKIHDSTSVGAIGSQVSGLPLPDEQKRKGITATQRNQFFDSSLARSLDRTQDLKLKEQVAALKQIAGTIQERIALTKDITRKLGLEDELVRVNRQRRSIEETIAANAEAARKAAIDAAAKLKAQRLAREKALAEAARNATQVRQFKALGLSGTGGDFVPTIGNLSKQLDSLTDRLSSSSTTLSSKLKGQLAGVRKILSGELGAATVETRARIKELFDTIRGEFDKGAKGPLTSTTSLNANRILEGLGLSRDDEKQLRARLSNFNSAGRALAPAGSGAFGRSALVGAGGGTTVIPLQVNIDGRPVANVVTKHQERRDRRNPPQTRGRNF